MTTLCRLGSPGPGGTRSLPRQNCWRRPP